MTNLSPSGRLRTMDITIIYDNTVQSDLKGLRSDWGFSALIRAHGKQILFDTGGHGPILLQNMKILGISPSLVTDIFISHNHFDHVGGLSHFLSINPRVTVHSPPSFRGVKHAEKVIYYEKPASLGEGLYSSGELDKIEQAMAVETDIGLFVITGCAHPRISDILKAFHPFGSVTGLAGGFHDNSHMQDFRDLNRIYPMHCTKNIENLISKYPSISHSGGVGTRIEL